MIARNDAERPEEVCELSHAIMLQEFRAGFSGMLQDGCNEVVGCVGVFRSCIDAIQFNCSRSCGF
jgi:hypothetical protein